MGGDEMAGLRHLSVGWALPWGSSLWVEIFVWRAHGLWDLLVKVTAGTKSPEVGTGLPKASNRKKATKTRSINSKRNQSWLFIGRTDAEAPIVWPSGAKKGLIGKDPDAGKGWRQEEKGTTEDEMIGWHHRFNGVWASSRSWWWTGKPGMLQPMGLQRVGRDWATEQQQDWKWGRHGPRRGQGLIPGRCPVHKEQSWILFSVWSLVFAVFIQERDVVWWTWDDLRAAWRIVRMRAWVEAGWPIQQQLVLFSRSK